MHSECSSSRFERVPCADSRGAGNEPLVQRVAATSPPVPFDGGPPGVRDVIGQSGNPSGILSVRGARLLRAIRHAYQGRTHLLESGGRLPRNGRDRLRDRCAAVVADRGAVGQLLRVNTNDERSRDSRPVIRWSSRSSDVGDVATITRTTKPAGRRFTCRPATSTRQSLLVRVAGNVDAAANSTPC